LEELPPWKKGYKSLQPKYALPRHKDKYRIAVELLGQNAVDWRRERRGNPDLLVYGGRKLAFFAEVKVEGDRLSDWRKKRLKAIARHLKCEVRVYYLKPRP
jgi:hypothetical protein